MTQRSCEILCSAFLAGAADLWRRSTLLDKINVFPVTDGDTGANMVQTISPMVKLLKPSELPKIASLPEVLCPPLLFGARGNSGVILSQFLVGFFQKLGAAGELSQNSFVSAVARGRELAYASVSNPVEGTMLTAIADLNQLLAEIGPITSLDSHARLERAMAEKVARTPSLMPRLAQAKVVDSGALGFHLLACGLTLCLPAVSGIEQALALIAARRAGENKAPLGEIADRIDPGFLKADLRNDQAERFCVNLLIKVSGHPDDSALGDLEKIGKSLDAAKFGDLVKLHLHCNNPDLAIAAAERLGQVIQRSVDDMNAAMARIGAGRIEESNQMQRFRVVGDSSMSLSPKIAGEIGIRRLENYVSSFGIAIRDSELDIEQLFKGMRKAHIFTTAQTSPEEVKRFLDVELTLCERLFFIAVGNAYTGTQETVRRVAAAHPESGRISVFDTSAASGQQGLICLASGRFSRAANSEKDLINYINNQIATCREYLVIDDMKYLHRTGRISWGKAALAGALSVKPIVGHGKEGAVTLAKTHSHEEALEYVTTAVASHPGSGKLLVMVEHTDNREWTGLVMAKLASSLPAGAEIVESPLSATSSVHMGPGTWGVAVTRL